MSEVLPTPLLLLCSSHLASWHFCLGYIWSPPKPKTKCSSLRTGEWARTKLRSYSQVTPGSLILPTSVLTPMKAQLKTLEINLRQEIKKSLKAAPAPSQVHYYFDLECFTSNKTGISLVSDPLPPSVMCPYCQNKSSSLYPSLGDLLCTQDAPRPVTVLPCTPSPFYLPRQNSKSQTAYPDWRSCLLLWSLQNFALPT